MIIKVFGFSNIDILFIKYKTDKLIIGTVKSATIYPPHRFVENICNQVKKTKIAKNIIIFLFLGNI